MAVLSFSINVLEDTEISTILLKLLPKKKPILLKLSVAIFCTYLVGLID